MDQHNNEMALREETLLICSKLLTFGVCVSDL